VEFDCTNYNWASGLPMEMEMEVEALNMRLVMGLGQVLLEETTHGSEDFTRFRKW